MQASLVRPTRLFSQLTEREYLRVVEHYLEDLQDKLDEVMEDNSGVVEDVSLHQSVLQLEMADSKIYVINKQTPNLQIWLSSPFSGPQRFDYQEGEWLNTRNG